MREGRLQNRSQTYAPPTLLCLSNSFQSLYNDVPVHTLVLAHYIILRQTRRSSTNIKQNAHIRVEGLANGVEEPSVRIELLLVFFFEHKNHLDRCNTACDIAHFVLDRISALGLLFKRKKLTTTTWLEY